MTSSTRIPVGELLELSNYGPQDVETLTAALNNQRIYETTLRIPYPYNAEHAEAYLQWVEQNEAESGMTTQLAIRKSTGRLIGGFSYVGLEIGHCTELGYWLAEDYWGRGIMTKVIKAACRHAESEWQIHRITAEVFAFNHASARVLEKNRFENEGLSRKRYLKDEKFIDSIRYARVK